MIIYINGIKASKQDIQTLGARLRSGLERIKEMHHTKNGNLAIVTL